MSKVVLDSSALLAFLRREPGAGVVAEVLPQALMSSVNLAEVLSSSLVRDAEVEAVRARLQVLPFVVVPFEVEDAVAAARLHLSTRQAGLSLGGRCCIALALRRGLPVLTTDQAWAGLDLGVQVEVVR